MNVLWRVFFFFFYLQDVVVVKSRKFENSKVHALGEPFTLKNRTQKYMAVKKFKKQFYMHSLRQLVILRILV